MADDKRGIRNGWKAYEPAASDDSADEREVIEATRRPDPPPPPPKEPDGFIRGFLNAEEMVRRVLAAGYTGVKSTQDTEILRIALGDIPLDEKSAKQIWLTFGYYFKEVLGGGFKNVEERMPPAVSWILCSLCGYVNSRKIAVPTPDIFSFADDTGFRDL
jgi:hypothetical protein